MLRSELYELEKTVGAIIDNSSTVNPDNYHQQIIEQAAYVKTLCADITKKWTHELLSNTKEQVIKRYVQYHQAGIIQLSNRLSRQLPALDRSEEIRATQAQLYDQVKIELEGVLNFLCNQFYQYFDLDHKATIYRCRLLSLKLTGFRLETTNYTGSVVEQSLIDVVLSSLKDIADEGIISGISYRQVDQSLSLAHLNQQYLLIETNTTTASFVKVLYQQNLNSLHFFNWYRDYMQAQIALISDKKEKQNYVVDQLKLYSGIFVSPDKAIEPELPSTDTFIIALLQEQTGSGTKLNKVRASVDQFPLNLSVPQFAVFIRIFYKTGCFSTENVAMITRYFSEHFTTKKQTHISHKSFGRAFYNIDQSAAAVVRDFLQKMLNYLNKTYFP